MWWRSAARAAALVGVVIAIRVLCVAPYRANLKMPVIEGRLIRAHDVDRITATRLARMNLEDLNLIATPQRLDPNWYMLFAANCEVLGRIGDAAETYSRALRIDQRPELYANRGMLLLQLGHDDAGIGDLATAARFNPAILNDLNGDLRTRVAAAAGLH